MEGKERRKATIELLQDSEKPLSGVYLGKNFGISRQVVVQDIALLRVEGYDILATARGYILNKDIEKVKSRIILVKHTRRQVEDELHAIIDNGGRVRNVIISHPVYGELVGDLMLKNRRDIKQFLDKLNGDSAGTLMDLTEGVHMHTIEAETEEELNEIEEELEKKGMLIKEKY
ncbi:MAG: 3H domain-containing protein [Cellulosilyticaceae bacterium]